MSEPTKVTPVGVESGEVATETNETGDAGEAREPSETLVEEDLLVEDVSIDGMCGVY